MIDSSKLNLSPMLEIDANVFVKTPHELAAKILESFQESEIKLIIPFYIANVILCAYCITMTIININS